MPAACRVAVAEMGEARFEAVEAVVGEAGVHLALAAVVEDTAPLVMRQLGEDLIRAFDLVEMGGLPRHERGKWNGFRDRLALQEAVLPWDSKKHPRGRTGTSTGGKFISKGSGGGAVRAVQRRVGAKVDGKYGPHTARAVRGFQKRHGLKVDGVVGRQTSLALRGHYSAARKAKPGALHSVDRRRLSGMGKRSKTRTLRTDEIPLAEAWGSPWKALLHPRGRGGQFRDTPDMPSAPRIARSRGGFGTQPETGSRPKPRTTKPPPRRSGIPKTSIAPKTPRRPQGPKDTGRDAPKLSEHELKTAVGKGPWSAGVDDAISKLSDSVDSEKHYRTAGGTGPYTPERTALHGRIASLLLQGSPASSKPQAVFLAGGPASGKTSIVRAGGTEMNGAAVDINPDIVKAMLPEFEKMKAAKDPTAAAKMHEESSHIAKMVMNLAVARKQNVLVDGVGNSPPGKFAGKIKAATDAGYDTKVVYATIPTDEAVARSTKRANDPKSDSYGRVVPEGYIRAAHKDVSARYIEDVSKLGVAIDVWDNTGRPPKLIAQHPKIGATTVHDRKAYADFVGKSGQRPFWQAGGPGGEALRSGRPNMRGVQVERARQSADSRDRRPVRA
jgi:predicted ABC-type ATPase